MCDISIEFLGMVQEDRTFSESKIIKQSRLIADNDVPLISQGIPVNRNQRIKTDMGIQSKSKSYKEFVRSKVTLEKIERPLMA